MNKNIWKGLCSLLLALCLLSAAPALAAEPGAEVTVPPQIVTDLPATLSAVAGSSATLSIVAEGEGLSYQWYFNNAPIEGAVGVSYSIDAVTAAHAGSYFCYVTNALGGAESSSCTLTVLEPPTLTADVNITALTLSEGDTINLSAAASGEGLSAQWYYVLNSTDIRPINGQTGFSLSVPATAELNGADIYCQFLNQAGAVATSFCHVTVNSPTPTPAAPVITKNPVGESVAEGDSALFIARADGAVAYVWRFVNTDGTSYDYTGINGLFPGLRVSGGDTDTLSLGAIPHELNGWSVRCLFKGEGGSETLSDAAVIYVQATASSITITRQPSGGTMALDENEDFTLSIQAAGEAGGTLSYQWYSSPTNSSASMTPIAGATNSSYRPPRTEGTTYYRVAVSVNRNGVTSQPFYSYTVGVTFTAGKAHTHAYSDAWEHDETAHWHQCICGDHSQEAAHSYEWTVIVQPTADQDGQQKGVCSVCGYETVERIPAVGAPQTTPGAEAREARKGGHTWIFVLLGLLAAGVIAGAAYLILRILRQDDEEWDEEDEDEPENEPEEEPEEILSTKAETPDWELPPLDGDEVIPDLDDPDFEQK